MENRTRPIPKKVRFNQQEWDYLENKIKGSPFDNFQNFARVMLINGEIKHIDYSELFHLNSEISRIGNNINQMAKLANQFEEISIDDIQYLTKELREIKKIVSQSLKKELKKGKRV